MAKVCLFRCRFGLGGTRGSPLSPEFGGALRLSPLRFRSPGPLPNSIPPPIIGFRIGVCIGFCPWPPSPPMLFMSSVIPPWSWCAASMLIRSPSAPPPPKPSLYEPRGDEDDRSR